MSQEFEFLNPQILIYLWVPFAALAFGIFGLVRSARIKKSISQAPVPDPGAGRIGFGRILLLSAAVSAILLTVLAAARPSFSKTETMVSRKGRDVVFVVDVSRSMLAEDLYPNRLARAKLSILDAISVIDGDRVGLVAFAGSSVVKCPLTLDYSFFKQSVEQLTTESVSKGGSMIGDALRKTLDDVLAGGSGGYKDIILITDGEDQESYPLKAAEMLGEREVRLIAIGLGDENEGKRIPITDNSGNKSFLTFNGQEVWSRLDAASLRKMASASYGGRYLNVSTGAFNMGEIYASLIKSQEARFIEDERSIEYDESFQYFLLPSVILFLIFLAGRYLFGGNRRPA